MKIFMKKKKKNFSRYSSFLKDLGSDNLSPTMIANTSPTLNAH